MQRNPPISMDMSRKALQGRRRRPTERSAVNDVEHSAGRRKACPSPFKKKAAHCCQSQPTLSPANELDDITTRKIGEFQGAKRLERFLIENLDGNHACGELAQYKNPIQTGIW